MTHFADESLTVSSGKLFCHACCEVLRCLKLSSITNHIKSRKHFHGKEKLKTKEARELDIAGALVTHNKTAHLGGETLPIDQQVYRVKVVTAFMRAGVPINKVSQFRDVLEENALRLTDRSHMSNLIPFIWQEEQKRIKSEINGRDISVVFDRTTRLGEAVVILIHYVTENMEISQRLLRVQRV